LLKATQETVRKGSNCSRCCIQVTLTELEAGELLCKPKGPLRSERGQNVFNGSGGLFPLRAVLN